MWLKSLQRNDPKKATVTFISFSLQLRKKKIYIFAGLFTIINKIIIRNNWIFLTFNILNFSQIHRIFNPNIFRGTWRNYKLDYYWELVLKGAILLILTYPCFKDIPPLISPTQNYYITTVTTQVPQPPPNIFLSKLVQTR